MKKIDWSPEFSVGVRMMDEQHKRLILMINKMIGAKGATTGSEIISELLSQMMQYAQEHFKAEEELLVEFNFPHLDRQKQCHREYRKKVADLSMAVPLGVSSVPQVMLNFFSKWWQNHILFEDMKYKSFFHKIGYF